LGKKGRKEGRGAVLCMTGGSPGNAGRGGSRSEGGDGFAEKKAAISLKEGEKRGEQAPTQQKLPLC